MKPHKHFATRLLVRINGVHVKVWPWWVCKFFHWRVRYMVNLNVTQKFTIEVAPVQDDGTPGAIDGPPTYPVDIAGVLTLIPSADGLSCECRGNTVGTCTITPTDTAGGNKIFGPPIDVTVTAAPLKPATKLVETISQVVPQ